MNKFKPIFKKNINHNEFEVKILKGAIFRKKDRGKTSTTILKASRQKHKIWLSYSNEENVLQQFQVESCQPIKRLKNKKKINHLTPYGPYVYLQV